MTKLNVYIALPMSGRSQSTIDFEMNVLRGHVNERHPHIEVLMLNFYDPAKELEPPLTVMADCLELLDRADVVYFSPNWRNSKGCRLEKTACELYGIPHVVVEKDILNNLA